MSGPLIVPVSTEAMVKHPWITFMSLIFWSFLIWSGFMSWLGWQWAVSSGETSEAVIRVYPIITVTREIPTSNEVSEFMNAIEYRCPDGYVHKDSINMKNVSYKVAFNVLSHAECVKGDLK